MHERFIRLAAGLVGGAKIARRHAVNPTLWLGPPDGVGGDTAYSDALEDSVTRVRFRAYAAQSGPASGGSPSECFCVTSKRG